MMGKKRHSNHLNQTEKSCSPIGYTINEMKLEATARVKKDNFSLNWIKQQESRQNKMMTENHELTYEAAQLTRSLKVG